MTRVLHAAAILLFLATVPAAASTSHELNTAGKAAYGRGEFAAAERLFAEAIAAAPGDPLLHYHRGAALVRLGRLPEARAAYQRALALNPPAQLAGTIRTALHEIAQHSVVQGGLTVGGSQAVRLEASRGVWFTDVMLNQARTARFLVDTGATFCAISPALADALGIVIPDGAQVVRVMGVSGPTKGRLISLDSIRLGDSESTGVPTLVMPLPPGLDGILGNTFLGRYSVTLDAQSRMLFLRTKP